MEGRVWAVEVIVVKEGVEKGSALGVFASLP